MKSNLLIKIIEAKITLPDPVWLLLEASAVCVLSLYRFRFQCYCSILSLPLYTFVVAVLTCIEITITTIPIAPFLVVLSQIKEQVIKILEMILRFYT